MKTAKAAGTVGNISAAIYVGPTKEAIESARDAILGIMAGAQSEAVACAGLKTLRKLCLVTNTNITNCTFTGKP